MTDYSARSSLLGGDRNRTANAGGGYQAQTSYQDQMPSEYGPIGQDTFESPQGKVFRLAFMIIIIVLVLISVILGLYRSILLSNGLYAMMVLSLVALLATLILLIRFVRTRDLEMTKTWILYAIGAAIALESILTNVLLFASA